MVSTPSSNIDASSNSPLDGLPHQFSPFLGREAEIAQIKQLLKDRRLVTLCGEDGVGKTSLALKVAGEVRQQFGDGVYLVPLDTIVSLESIIGVIARKLGIKINPRFGLLEQFFQELSPKKILLILDDFESGPDQNRFLKQLFDLTSDVKVVITSREYLRSNGETVVKLDGLPVPDPDTLDAEASPSVQLFLQHARAFPDFAPDFDAIAHICRLLDGMPFAIELASAWTMSTDDLSRQIELSLSLHPPDIISGRYPSMTAILDSLWEFFSETEKRTLMGLSVFQGGFSQQAASKVLGASNFFLDSLVNKKLIHRDGPQRYALHASVLQYLQEKLHANPILATDVEIRHGSHYLGLLRDSEAALGLSDSMPLLEEILPDAENIRYAWKRTVAVGNLRLVQSALSAWISILWNRGWYKEAMDDLGMLSARLTEFSDTDPDAALLYVRVKKFQGEFLYLIGDPDAGLRELKNGIQRIIENDQLRDESDIYHLMGDHRDLEILNRDAKEMYRHGLTLAEKVGELALVYKFINRLAMGAYIEADYSGAIPIAKHALEIARQLQDRDRIARSLSDLGNLYYMTKDYPRAKQILTEALEYVPAAGNQVLECTILNTLGRTLVANREYAQAARVFSQGLSLLQNVDVNPLTIGTLMSVSELLNFSQEKSLASALVSLLINHPESNVEVQTRAIRLQRSLNSEKVQAEKNDWTLDQLGNIVGDLVLIFERKADSPKPS
jgi:non-specific serine/threonine protein kinase